MKLKDKLWLWGQTEGSHHIDNAFGLPDKSRMSPMEGAYYFGIKNMCRVVMRGLPALPFDQDAMVLDTMDNVVWSIVGDSSSGLQDYTREIARLAKLYPNISGAIMDDVFRDSRLDHFTPEVIAGYKKTLAERSGRELPLWAVVYVKELLENRKPYFAACDVLQMWTWHSEDLLNLEENLAKLKELAPGKKIFVGCYMWDYGNKCEMPEEKMQLQLDTYYKWLKEGKIEGVVFCSNCCADLGLKASDMVRDFVRIHGDEEI